MLAADNMIKRAEIVAEKYTTIPRIVANINKYGKNDFTVKGLT
jgi:hypothetical protein